MKLDLNTPSAQVVFQGARALISIALVFGITILYVQEGSNGVLSKSWDNLAQASSLISGLVG